MCNHSVPVFNTKHYIFDEDQTSWMMLWSKPDSMDDFEYVVMLDNNSRVVVVPNELFNSSFVEEEDPNYPLGI